MFSKYSVFCMVLEEGSFTKVANELGYTQSAVSQMIKTIEQELSTTLIKRSREGISLTEDGRDFYPFLLNIYTAEKALERKKHEMEGLEGNTIRIGTFTSVSRNLLPYLMKSFKEKYPGVNYVLQQGEYTSIANWIREGKIDFGFHGLDSITGLTHHTLYTDEMMAVLPPDHPLTKRDVISLKDIEHEPLIVLDEGEYSHTLHAFEAAGLSPKIEYTVTDDYSILAMVREGLGISMIYSRMLSGYNDDVEVRPISEKPKRDVSICWSRWDTMPMAARRFAKYLIDKSEDIG